MTLPQQGFPDWQRQLGMTLQEVHTDTVDAAGGTTSSFGHADFRSYSSFVLSAEVLTNVAATGFNPLEIALEWNDDTLSTHTLFVESYEVFAFTNGGAFNSPHGRLFVQDNVKGSQLSMAFNNLGPDTVRTNFTLWGSSRTLPGPYVRETKHDLFASTVGANMNSVNANIAGIAAGATNSVMGRLAPGRIGIRMAAFIQPFTFNLFIGGLGNIEAFAVPLNTTQRQELIVPARSIRWAVQNTGAGVGQFTLDVTRLLSPL